MVYKLISFILLKHIIYCEIFNPESRDPGIKQPVNPESRDWRILSGIANPNCITSCRLLI